MKQREMISSLNEENFYRANIELQNQIFHLKDDMRILINHIEGNKVDPVLLKKIIDSYRDGKNKPRQRGMYDYD